MPDQCYYPNAVSILQLYIDESQKDYELLRNGCEKDLERATKAQEQYDLACELRHAANVLRTSNPSGVIS